MLAPEGEQRPRKQQTPAQTGRSATTCMGVGGGRATLRVSTEDLTGSDHLHSPDGLNDMLVSQECVLPVAPGWVELNSKDRGRGEEPLIAWSSCGVHQQ